MNILDKALEKGIIFGQKEIEFLREEFIAKTQDTQELQERLYKTWDKLDYENMKETAVRVLLDVFDDGSELANQVWHKVADYLEER